MPLPSTEHELIQHTKRTTWVARIVYWLLLLCITIILGMAVWVFALAPPPVVFARTELITPVVYAGAPGNVVRLKTWVARDTDSNCLLSTQYFITFSNGEVAKLPGRRRWLSGDTKQAIYETDIPESMSVGPAKFFVVDSYNCYLQLKRVRSPVGSILIAKH